jgi:anti-sigma regulatory factor (Ser/Thr protein kinase)
MSQTRSFDHVPTSVALARQFVRDVTTGMPAELIQTAQLIVSELASNCVVHTGSAFDLQIIRRADEIRIAATDHGDGDPVLRSPGPTDTRGRGLQIVDMLATSWGVNRLPEGGKTVWALIALSAQGRVLSKVQA